MDYQQRLRHSSGTHGPHGGLFDFLLFGYPFKSERVFVLLRALIPASATFDRVVVLTDCKWEVNGFR